MLLAALKRSRRAGAAAALAATLVGAAFLAAPALPLRAQPSDVRALWVVRTTLTSPEAIATMVASARTSGFNTLLVQVRGRADAYYADGLEPRPAALTTQPAFDPLATTIARAHEAGLQVHAWVNVNLVAAVNELPSARDHVVYRHPEWLMVPRALAADLAALDPRSPEYLGRLARYVRRQPAEVEGLYLSPMAEGAVAYTAGVVRDIVERYRVDGIHFDYLRYPTEDFDYSRTALTAFRESRVPDLAKPEAARYDARLATDPLVYTQAFPEQWRTFRVSRLSSLLSRLRQDAKSLRPGLIVSAAVGPDAEESALRRFQDWRAWVQNGLVDVVCPMAYTADTALFEAQIAAARQITGLHPLWAGIGAYRLSPSQIVDHVQAARRLGAGGIILFSYDSLSGPGRGPDYLPQLGRAAFADQQF